MSTPATVGPNRLMLSHPNDEDDDDDDDEEEEEADEIDFDLTFFFESFLGDDVPC